MKSRRGPRSVWIRTNENRLGWSGVSREHPPHPVPRSHPRTPVGRGSPRATAIVSALTGIPSARRGDDRRDTSRRVLPIGGLKSRSCRHRPTDGDPARKNRRTSGFRGDPQADQLILVDSMDRSSRRPAPSAEGARRQGARLRRGPARRRSLPSLAAAPYPGDHRRRCGGPLKAAMRCPSRPYGRRVIAVPDRPGPEP